MKRASLLIAATLVIVIGSDAFAQTNDHFARQRREAANRAAAANHIGGGVGHWGGPTTNHRWYPNQGGRGQIFIQRQIQFVPVSPFGYGYPGYGYGNRFGGWNPYFGGGYGLPIGQHIYIHREIHR